MHVKIYYVLLNIFLCHSTFLLEQLFYLSSAFYFSSLSLKSSFFTSTFCIQQCCNSVYKKYVRLSIILFMILCYTSRTTCRLLRYMINYLIRTHNSESCSQVQLVRMRDSKSVSNPMDKGACNSIHYQYYGKN